MNKKYSQFLNSNKFFISLIILILLAVYFNSFFHKIIFLDDDTLIYSKFSGMDLLQKISNSFTSNYLDVHYYRPITLLSIIIDSVLGGHSYFIYHLTNIVIHLLLSVLIFTILRELGFNNIISFLTTLLIALSPIQINAVGWIAGRGDLLAALFSVAALLLFIKFIKKDRTYLLIFVSVFLFLAILSKEAALPVPFLFLGLYFILKKKYVTDKNSLAVLAMAAIVTGSYYLLRGLFLTGVHIDKFSFTTYYKNILVLPETISKFFIPAGIQALSGNEIFTSVSGIILLVILIILPLKLKSMNRSRYYFGIVWIILLLLPGMVFRTMGQDGFFYWDCRSYLPLAGLLFIISEIFNALNLHNNNRYYLIVIFYLLIIGTTTITKLRIYENPVTYWDSVKTDYPSSFLPYIGLFNYYSFNEDLIKAENQLVMAMEIRPDELSIRDKLFTFYYKHNWYQKAGRLLKKTLIDDRIYSDYLAQRYLTLPDGNTIQEKANDLLGAYKGEKGTLEKIRKTTSDVNKKILNQNN